MSNCTTCGGRGWLWKQTTLDGVEERKPCPMCKTRPPKSVSSTALTEAYKRIDALERDVEVLAQKCADKELELRQLRRQLDIVHQARQAADRELADRIKGSK
ncbi:MAG TPA: hypothetical protein VFH61_13895 [Thermoleophilia bacterium]|nr:hypothetical protein [Thermoleophilia bacterium]